MGKKTITIASNNAAPTLSKVGETIHVTYIYGNGVSIKVKK